MPSKRDMCFSWQCPQSHMYQDLFEVSILKKIKKLTRYHCMLLCSLQHLGVVAQVRAHITCSAGSSPALGLTTHVTLHKHQVARSHLQAILPPRCACWNTPRILSQAIVPQSLRPRMAAATPSPGALVPQTFLWSASRQT